jgi:L-cysteine:1D-myo-inositol 2-amino-2-deoxy-alpha-D-glucopyranoside ligase
LIFPHHEMSAGHAAALSGHPLARVYSHTGMVAYRGEKMSKSLGNLVLVSKLLEAGVDARAIRLTLLAHHYRSDWEWTDAALSASQDRLAAWSARLADDSPGSGSTVGAVAALREALRIDLDTPAALAVIDAVVASGVDDPALLRRAVHALLGVEL